MTTTLFSWGYYGWGNHTADLVKAVDTVEASRGFQQPLFVDTRIRRSVRAVGFQGKAFEKLIGASRHTWMPSLGNKAIVTRTGPAIQIADPLAAETLLDRALESARHKQRLIFFCGCQWPREDGQIACHRTAIASLLLKAASKRGIQVRVEEWPGREPTEIELHVPPKDFSDIKKRRSSVPLGASVDLAKLAGLPWCSIASLRSGGETLYRIVGPATRHTTEWVLPILWRADELNAGPEEYKKKSKRLRKERGLDPVIK
jgi:hypothetical protein